MTSQHTPRPIPFHQLPVTALSDEQASTLTGGTIQRLQEEFAAELATLRVGMNKGELVDKVAEKSGVTEEKEKVAVLLFANPFA